MNMLDNLQTALSEIAEVRVAARYISDKLRFSNPKDLRVFVPDIHLMPAARRARFGFKGPHSKHRLLLDTLRRLCTFRTSVKAADSDAICAVYFLGDLLDLWRAAPPKASASEAADLVSKDHTELMDAVCDADLKARIALGNHDFELCKVPSFVAADRRFFFPPNSPSVVCLHGDVLDWIEDFPDKLNEFMVYYFSPFTNLLDHAYEEVKEAILSSNNKVEYLGSTEVTSIPESEKDVVASSARTDAEKRHELFKRAEQMQKEVNAQFGLDLRAFVIGHSHKPRIVPYESDSEFFSLIDTGGWIEDACENRRDPERGMITGLCSNEVRIFNLAVKW